MTYPDPKTSAAKASAAESGAPGGRALPAPALIPAAPDAGSRPARAGAGITPPDPASRAG